MTIHYRHSESVPLKQTVHGVLFSARFVRVMGRMVLRRVLRDACMWHARKIFRKRNGSKSGEPGIEKQEWYSLSELAVIYGVSRRTLGRILKEAENQGKPVRLYNMTNPENEANSSRRRPCIRINRKSLDEYLEARSREGGKE